MEHEVWQILWLSICPDNSLCHLAIPITQVLHWHPISSQFFIRLYGSPSLVNTWSFFSQATTWLTLLKKLVHLDPSTIPLFLSPYISFQHQIPPVSFEELTLPRSAPCALSRLRCYGHSTLLTTYLHRIGRPETSSCSNCGFESQDIFHLVLDWSALDSLRLAILGTPSPFRTSARVLGGCPIIGSAELIRAPIPRNGSGKPTTTRSDSFGWRNSMLA